MTSMPVRGRRPGAAVLVLTALVAGIVIGALIQASGAPGLIRAAGNVEILATIWINAIRMTVIPLVAALTIVAVATSGDAAKLGKLGGYTLLTFTVLLLGAGFLAMLLAPFALGGLDIAPDVAARLRESLGAAVTNAPAAMPSLSQRIVDMVPVNPIKAAADGTVLPVVVFSLALGAALTRLPAAKREPFIEVCRAVADALLVLVQWVLALTPIGVFAIAMGVGAKMGAGSAGAFVHYMIALSAVLFVATLLLYPVAVILGRVSPARFAAAALPAQAVGFSTRSSIVALPAMLTAARDTLGLSPRASSFTLSLAVSSFRFNVPPAWVLGLIFLGKLYSVPVTQGSVVLIVVTATLISFSVPGLPSASLFLLAPVIVQFGIPAEGVGILIALDLIPDMFKTMANVTAHLTSAAIVSRATGGAPSAGSVAQE